MCCAVQVEHRSSMANDQYLEFHHNDRLLHPWGHTVAKWPTKQGYLLPPAVGQTR